MNRIFAFLGTGIFATSLVCSGFASMVDGAMDPAVPHAVRLIDPSQPEKDFRGLVGPVREVLEKVAAYRYVSGEWIEKEQASSFVRMYDRYGRVLAQGDSEHSLARFCRTYDGHDRLTLVARCDDTGLVSRPIGKYVYDEDDLVTKISFRSTEAGAFIEEVRYRYRRDRHHRAVEVFMLHSEGETLERDEYVYDDVGRLQEERRFLGMALETGVPFKRIIYQYGEDGRVTISSYRGKETQPDELSVERYDSHGNLVERRWSGRNDLSPYTEGMTYEYDAVGNWIMCTRLITHDRLADQAANEKEIIRRTIAYHSK